MIVENEKRFNQATRALDYFMQLNWTGPAVIEVDIELATDSEPTPAIFNKCTRPDLLFHARKVFRSLKREEFPTLPIWQGRAAFALQRVLEEANDRGSGHDWELMMTSTRDLAEWLHTYLVISTDNYNCVLASLPKVSPAAFADADVSESRNFPPLNDELCLTTKTALICELTNRLAYYNKLNALSGLLAQASEYCGFRFELTGAEGIRRKYQTETFAQMHCRTWNFAENQPVSAGSAQPVAAVLLTDVEPDTDILERPVLVAASSEEDDQLRELSAAQQLVLLSECGRVYYDSYDHDTLTLETVNALVTRALHLETASAGSADWLVFSSSLYWRCKAEFLRTKTRGRSSFQLEALVKQFHEIPTEQTCRTRFVYSLGYPSVWEMQRELGERMMQMGMAMTAYEQFHKLEMWTLAVDCLAIAGRKHQAVDLAKSLLQADKGACQTPASRALLLCSVGDLTGDITHYEEAWQVSNGSCARAQRSLGRVALKTGDWTKTCEHFEKALEIAPLFAEIWFSLGAAWLRRTQLEKAASCFVRSLGIEEDNWQTWANLSAVNIQQGLMQSAKTAAWEAVKRNKSNFKLWENLSIVSMCLHDLQTALTAEKHLVLVLKREDRPDQAVLRQLFIEARSRRLVDQSFFNRTCAFFSELVNSHLSIRTDYWRICAMTARLSADKQDHSQALDIVVRGLRAVLSQLGFVPVQEISEGLSEILTVLDELLADSPAQPQSITGLLMTVKAIPTKLVAIGLSESAIDSLCTAISKKLTAMQPSFPEEE